MFPKLIAVLIATIAMSQFPQTRGYTIPFLILALAIVFVIEGVRVVPQQSAWVIERMGRFHAILQPGMNVIVPFVDRVAPPLTTVRIPHYEIGVAAAQLLLDLLSTCLDPDLVDQERDPRPGAVGAQPLLAVEDAQHCLGHLEVVPVVGLDELVEGGGDPGHDRGAAADADLEWKVEFERLPEPARDLVGDG